MSGFLLEILLLLLLLLLCRCLLSHTFFSWHFYSRTNSDPYRTGFKFQIAILSVLCCDVSSTTVFCSGSNERFPLTASKFLFKTLATIPVALIVTGIMNHLYSTFVLSLYINSRISFYRPGQRSPYSDSPRLDGPGIESRWGRDFPAPVQTGPGAYPASYTMGTGSFPGVKRPGRGVVHPPPSSDEVKERVHLYLYSPYGPSWHVPG